MTAPFYDTAFLNSNFLKHKSGVIYLLHVLMALFTHSGRVLAVVRVLLGSKDSDYQLCFTDEETNSQITKSTTEQKP